MTYDGKYVLKVVSNGEMRMFNDFAPIYFEYMCRSFNQKCPTSIAKTLGAFKVNIKKSTEKTTHNVILMENLSIGLEKSTEQLLKYDLKGSMSNRYVDLKGQPDYKVTKLDTNFLEDQDSKPFVMNYTMNRLMEIAIHNDASFLTRYNKVDYSFLVIVDRVNKLIRVGIIYYI
jgi:1-phosphatidylinositol-3-phosphate 5-kinase